GARTHLAQRARPAAHPVMVREERGQRAGQLRVALQPGTAVGLCAGLLGLQVGGDHLVEPPIHGVVALAGHGSLTRPLPAARADASSPDAATRPPPPWSAPSAPRWPPPSSLASAASPGRSAGPPATAPAPGPGTAIAPSAWPAPAASR